MLKSFIANVSSRMLRAAVGRISGDLELMRMLQAATSSATMINRRMSHAVACSSRMEVMECAWAQTQRDGLVCELGVYRGDSLNLLASHFSPAKVYGFDTFTGLPERWRDEFPEGAFDVSHEHLTFSDNCVLYKGLFAATLPRFLRDVIGPTRFIHIDCDLYSSTKTVLDVLKPRIIPSTVILFDEFFNYPDWQSHEYRAFQDFLNQTKLDCSYIAYNKHGQQVAVAIAPMHITEGE